MPFSSIQDVQDEIRNHFFTPASLSRAVAFAEAERQREGWFNGELVYLFSLMKKREAIKSWFEYSTPDRKRRDLKVELADAAVVIEIKAAATFYKGGTVGIRRWATDCANEVPKFLTLPATNHYVLLFAYRAPQESDWKALVNKTQALVNEEALRVSIAMPRPPDSTPGGELSIGWLQVSTQV